MLALGMVFLGKETIFETADRCGPDFALDVSTSETAPGERTGPRGFTGQAKLLMATPHLLSRFPAIIVALSAVGLCLDSRMAHAQATTVFSDAFGTSQGATFTTTGAIGTSPWGVTRPGADWGARIDGGILDLTNDASATTNVNGWVYASVPTSGFASPWNSTLSSNPGLVTWDFNMRQIRTSPSGFSSGSYGAAFVLGATSTNVGAAGNGYAVVLGNGGTGIPDPVRLVSFTGGIQSLGTATGGLISAPTPLDNPGASYMSLRVTYDPVTNGWAMFGRNDGATAFADPTVGTLTALGTATSSTYTSVPLTSMGGFWNGSTGAAQTAFFDNVSVSVTPVAPVSSLYWDGVAGWNAAAPGSGGSGTWVTGSGGWDPTQKAVFAASGGAVTVDAGGVTATNGIDFEANGYTLSGGSIAFGSTSQVVAVTAASTATIDSVITGSNGLSKTLAGTLDLGGVNTFTGNVVISGGTLSIAADTALGNATNDLTVNGTLQTTSTLAFDAGRDLSGSGTIDIAPGTTLTVNGATAMTGLTLASAGTLSLQGATRSIGNLTINSPLELQAAGGPVSATGLTAPGLTSDTATITPAITLTSGDKTVNVPGTGRLVLQGAVDGLGTSRLAKTGIGTLEINGSLSGGIRVGAAGTDGGTVVLGQAASAGTTSQVQLNAGTLRTDEVGGLALTPGLSIGGRDAVRAVLGAGGAMSFAGTVSFFGSGSGDYVLEVNNASTLSGAVTLAAGTSATGWTIRGTGDLTLAGTSPGLTAPITLADSVMLNVTGSTASAVTVNAANVLTGTGTIGGTIGGAGSVQPGASPGILTVGSVNPTAGTDFVLEFTGALPVYSTATASTNDVVRVTAATPFSAAMTSTNRLDMFLGVTSLAIGSSFEGGFYTDTAGDFTSSVSDATLNYYVLGDGQGTDATLGGQGFYSFATWKTSTGADPALALSLSTIARTATFVTTPVNGQAMVVSAVPEPGTLGLAAAAVMAAAGYALRRKKAS